MLFSNLVFYKYLSHRKSIEIIIYVVIIFCSKIPVIVFFFKKAVTQNLFRHIYNFQNVYYPEITLYQSFHQNPLNYGKTTTMKLVLHFHYLTNVDYTEKVYASKTSYYHSGKNAI